MACLWKINLMHKYNYCCLKCGKTVDLSLHHIFPRSLYPHMKTSMVNQVVLCQECHGLYHCKYLKRKIELCNPLTFCAWLGDDYLASGFTRKPVYLVRLDKRYHEDTNRIFKDDADEVIPNFTDLVYLSTATFMSYLDLTLSTISKLGGIQWDI